MQTRVVTASEYERTRWRNDGGWTTEVARDTAPDGAGFRWRVSIAEIETDGPFSSFPGVDRELLLLEGNGISLIVDGGEPVRLERPLDGVRFAGEAAVECSLLDGPTRDFNVMTCRADVVASVRTHALDGVLAVQAEPHTERLVHVVSGRLEATAEDRTHAVDAGDTLLLGLGQGSTLRGEGRLVVVGFAAVATA